MYYVNEFTGSLWYQWRHKQEITHQGYLKDYSELFKKLNISVCKLPE